MRLRARKLLTGVFTILVVCALLYPLFMECPTYSVSHNKPPLKPNVPFCKTDGPMTSNSRSGVSLVASDQKEKDELDPLVTPPKASKDERIDWFIRKLPELEILNSTSKSRRFHGRVLELYNKNCSAQFFMVWLSPAKSFGAKEMLAVDTLFTSNPGACLAILSNSLDSPRGYTILKPLLDRGLNLVAEYSLTIVPPDAFYPVNWIKIPRLFKKPATTTEAKWVAKTVQGMSKRSYMIHLWNKITRKLKIEEDSVMHRLIYTHCTVCGNITNSHT